MSRIKTERTIHDNKAVVKLFFDYDAALVARIRLQLPIARCSRTMRCWYMDDQSPKIVALRNPGIKAGQKTLLDVIAFDGNIGILKRFSDYMREKRYSSQTANRYVECLRIFLKFHQPKHYLDINNTDVTVFNKDYILAKKLSATYQRQFVNAIKLFYEKIPRKKLIIEQLDRSRKGSPLPYVLSKEDVARLISATTNIKHKAILSTIYSCGLRRGEVLNMRITDIDSKRSIINIRHAKRIIPLSNKILQLLRGYVKQYKPKEWLFEGQIVGMQKRKQVLSCLARYIRFVTVMQRIYWKQVRIFYIFRHCSVISIVKQLKYIPMLRQKVFKTSNLLSMIWRYKINNSLEIGCSKISILFPEIPIMGANGEHQ